MNLDYLEQTYQLTKTERQILAYLNQQCQATQSPNIRQTAKACYTSPTSVVRLAKKLNFAGYNELIYKIKEAQLPNPIPTETALQPTEIKQFVELMLAHQDKIVVVLGSGFSAHLSSYISEVLNFHTIPSINTANTQLLNSQNSLNFLFIIVSHSGEDAHFAQTLALAKANQRPIIAFVGTRNTTITAAADLYFSTDSFSPFSTDVAKAQLFFGRTLVTFETLISAYLNQLRNK